MTTDLAEIGMETLTWETACAAFELRCASQNLSWRTIALYRSQLRIFREWAHGAGLRSIKRVAPTHIRAFLEDRKKSGATSLTVDSYFRLLRTFWNFLVRDGLVAESPMRRVERPRRDKRMVKPFTPEQIAQMLNLLDPADPINVRDRALILFLADSGLRISEALAIKTGEIDWRRRCVKVFGKGRKERRAFFGENAAKAVRSWLEVRQQFTATDLLWISRRGAQLTQNAFSHRIKDLTEEGGFAAPRLSPHAFRHFFALNFLRNGGNIIALQRILGHEDLTMVRNYANMSDEDAEEQHHLAAPIDRLGLAA